jgi:hypothetical protein
MKFSKPSMLSFTSCLLLFLLSTCFAQASQAQQRVPQFKDFAAGEQYRGKPHAVVLTGEARNFRTRIKEAAQGKPNFAGHYIVAIWGCGSECLEGAVIDAKTGRVYMLPFTLCCWKMVDDNFKPLEYRADSKLLIFSGARNEKDGDNGAHYYKFENNRFVFIRSIMNAAGG